MLCELKTGQFSEWFVGNSLFDFINICVFRYNSSFLDASNSYERNRADFGYVQPQGEFYMALSQLAVELQSHYAEGSYERAWVDFLVHPSDAIFAAVKEPTIKNTQFAQLYNSRLTELVNQPELHMSLLGGIWVPTGELSTLGVHPSLGFQVGSHSLKSNWDLTFAFKFNNTPRPYYAYPYDYFTEKVATTYFLGGYIAIDWGKCLARKIKVDFLVLAGIGYDGFDVTNQHY